MKRVLTWVAGLLLAASACADTAEPKVDKPLLTIVIDDIGYNERVARALIRLPLELTFAVLPEAPHSAALANLAWRNGREFMLHIPMATKAGNRLDAGGLYEHMDTQTLQQTLFAHLQRHPRAAGINNHMGSRLTEIPLAMRAVMESLDPRRHYFLDSKTSAQSVAYAEALKAGLISARRDVFLDNDPRPEAIQRQLDLALQTAHRNGRALAIGHPHPETLAVLKANRERLANQVLLVRASQYMRTISHNKRDTNHTLDPFWTTGSPWKQAALR